MNAFPISLTHALSCWVDVLCTLEREQEDIFCCLTIFTTSLIAVCETPTKESFLLATHGFTLFCSVFFVLFRALS